MPQLYRPKNSAPQGNAVLYARNLSGSTNPSLKVCVVLADLSFYMCSSYIPRGGLRAPNVTFAVRGDLDGRRSDVSYLKDKAGHGKQVKTPCIY